MADFNSRAPRANNAPASGAARSNAPAKGTKPDLVLKSKAGKTPGVKYERITGLFRNVGQDGSIYYTGTKDGVTYLVAENTFKKAEA